MAWRKRGRYSDPEPEPGPEWSGESEPDLPPDLRIACAPHPDVELQHAFRWLEPGRLPIGMAPDTGGWALTQRDQHLLAIAPPQSHAGKSSSIIIPQIIAHPGPVVAATTKPDVLPATAMVRAQAGNLWCYAPDGDTSHLPEGVRELRWSPVSGAGEWDVALTTARSMVQALSTEGLKDGTHWTDRAAALLAPIFHWAALAGGTMSDVVAAVNGHRTILGIVLDGLQARNATIAAALLTSFMDTGDAERGSIASSASRALQAYNFSGAMRSTENVNFDPVEFVNGGNPPVRADTIYITGGSRGQRNVASLVVGLLSQIQDAAYRRHRNLTAKGLLGETGSGPILFALDELFNLAPLPDLPRMLSESASQGIVITAAVQDLTLVKSRWPNEAGSFLSLFGHVVIFPRVRDGATLKHISDLLGKRDVEYRSETRKQRPSGTPILDRIAGLEPDYGTEEHTEHATYSTQQRPRYDIDAVSDGPVPDDPDYVFHFSPLGWEVLRMTPYHRAAPWPAALTAHLERAISGRVPGWRWWESFLSHTRPDVQDILPGLPVPRLHPWATVAAEYGPAQWEREWGSRFLRAVEERDEILRRGPRQAQWDLQQPHAPMWCVTHKDALLPTEPGPGVGERRPDAPGPPPDVATATPHLEAATVPPSRIGVFAFEAAWTAEDEAVMRTRADSDALPAANQAMWNALELAILDEKRRRRDCGDIASIVQFDTERTRIVQEFETNPAFVQQCRDEVLTALLNGDDWGWWKYMQPALMRHIQAFLLGEEVGSYGEGPTAAPATPAAAAAPAAEPSPPVPEVAPADPVPAVSTPPRPPPRPAPAPEPDAFPFTAAWTAEDDAAMRARTLDSPWPEAFVRTFRGLEDALDREAARRRQGDDDASVERFERARARWSREWYCNPDRQAELEEERLEAVITGQLRGFWAWLPLVQVRGIQTFLRGEPLDPAFAEGPLPPTPLPRTFPFEEHWTLDADAAMHLHGGPPYPPAYQRTWDALELAIIAEKRRRRAQGDTTGGRRFDEARAALVAEWKDNPELQAQYRAEGEAAVRRGENWGWWKWMAIPLMRLIQTFLRGEEVGSYGEGPTAPPAAPDEHHPAPAPAAAANPTPEVRDVPTPERWEPDWGPEDTAAMQAMTSGGDPPERYIATIHAMNAAVEREGQRRRTLGDTASVERYHRERQLVMEAATHAEAQEGWHREQLEAQTRGEDLGFWLCIPPGLAVITRAFLRGEGVEIPPGVDQDTSTGVHPPVTTAAIPPAASAPAPVSEVPDGLTRERWEEIQAQTSRERAERRSRRWT